MRLDRRTVLLGGLGLALTGCSPDTPAPPAVSTTTATTTTDAVTTTPVTTTTTTSTPPPPPVRHERVASAARGTQVGLITIAPEGVPPNGLPVCLALHGRYATAQHWVDLGVPQLLTAAVRAGVKPFAVAALDGGDSYWVARDPRDDPQRMLTAEVPGWLAQRGFAAQPFAAMGISMGSYGALNYVRGRKGVAAAVISPALFASWGNASAINGFASQTRWEATEPLRHTAELDGNALGVFCGTSDPFIPVARTLATQTRAKVAQFTPGGHEDNYWRRALPEVLKFLGTRLG